MADIGIDQAEDPQLILLFYVRNQLTGHLWWHSAVYESKYLQMVGPGSKKKGLDRLNRSNTKFFLLIDKAVHFFQLFEACEQNFIVHVCNATILEQEAIHKLFIEVKGLAESFDVALRQLVIHQAELSIYDFSEQGNR